MAEYIEREAVITKFKKMELGEHGLVERLFADGVYAIIAAFPSADVAPVVHGRWDETDWVEMESSGHELIRTPNAALRCSNCCNCFEKKLLWKNNYCPNCGAKMD